MRGSVDRRVFLRSSLAAGAALSLPAPLTSWAPSAPPLMVNEQQVRENLVVASA